MEKKLQKKKKTHGRIRDNFLREIIGKLVQGIWYLETRKKFILLLRKSNFKNHYPVFLHEKLTFPHFLTFLSIFVVHYSCTLF